MRDMDSQFCFLRNLIIKSYFDDWGVLHLSHNEQHNVELRTAIRDGWIVKSYTGILSQQRKKRSHTKGKRENLAPFCKGRISFLRYTSRAILFHCNYATTLDYSNFFCRGGYMCHFVFFSGPSSLYH